MKNLFAEIKNTFGKKGVRMVVTKEYGTITADEWEIRCHNKYCEEQIAYLQKFLDNYRELYDICIAKGYSDNADTLFRAMSNTIVNIEDYRREIKELA